MSEGVLIRYKIFCNTEKRNKYWWKEEHKAAPTKCPDDTAHSVNLSSVSQVGRRDPSEVRIREVDEMQDGHFYSDSIDFVANGPKGTVTQHTFSYPTATSIAVGDWIGLDEHHGDIISIKMAPDTVIGAAGYFVTEGNTSFPFAPPQYPGQPRGTEIVKVGYFLQLTDGVGMSSSVEVTAIDKDTDTVTFYPPIETHGHVFSPFSPTYVMMTVYMVENRMLSHAAHLELGKSLIGGSDIPPHTPIMIEYTNNMPSCRLGKVLEPLSIGDTAIRVSPHVFTLRLAKFNSYVCITNKDEEKSVELQIQNWDASELPEYAIMHVSPPLDRAFTLEERPVVELTGTKHVVFATEGKKGSM